MSTSERVEQTELLDNEAIFFGASIVPDEFSRRTSRETTDTRWRGPRNMGSRTLSRDGREPRSPSDNGMVQIGTDGIEVLYIQKIHDDDVDLISRWSQSAGSGAPPEMMAEKDPDEFLTGGLAYQSLEDIRFSFAVRGVTRAVTHMLVRTRQAAFKQQSQQETWQGNAPEFRIPESVWVNPVVRGEWIRALILTHQVYNLAIDADIQRKDARYILPEGTTNFIYCEYSLRTFMEMYAYRGCVMFQEELVYVMREMRRLLVEAHPYLEPHIKISCEKQRVCTFQGPERIEETCTFPWAKENNRIFRQGRSGFAS